MKVSALEEKHLLDGFGMFPLKTDTGVEILDKVIMWAQSAMDDNVLAISHLTGITGIKDKIDEQLRIKSEPATMPIEKTASSFTTEITPSMVETFIKEALCEAFSVSYQTLDSQTLFSDLGIDSAGLLKTCILLNEGLGIDLKPPLFFELTTVGQLTDYLWEHYKDHFKTNSKLKTSMSNK